MLGNFELYRALGLALNHRHTFADPVSCDKIGHFQSDEIATPQLAVEREIKQRQVPEIARKFEPGTNGPDLLRQQRTLLPDKPASIPSLLLRSDGGELDIGHEKSSTFPSRSTRQHRADEPILSKGWMVLRTQFRHSCTVQRMTALSPFCQLLHHAHYDNKGVSSGRSLQVRSNITNMAPLGLLPASAKPTIQI